MVKPLKIMALCVVAFVLLMLSPSVWDWFTTKSEEYHFAAQQREGGAIDVCIRRLKKGLFISGGHAWSIGSTVESYEMLFNCVGEKIKWQGPGAPIILQQDGGSFYLATFDRETDFRRSVFRCYKWRSGWEPLPQSDFPKRLAIDNLLNFDSAPISTPDTENFRTSLLAKFWYCIANQDEFWRVSDSMMSKDFVMQYYKRWIRPD